MSIKPSEVAQKVKDIIDTNKETLGINDTFYGDQLRIPRARTVVVEAGQLTKSDRGSANQKIYNFQVWILVYVAKAQDEQVTKKEAEQLGENISDALEQHLNLDGLVIYGYVTRNEPGYYNRQGQLYMGCRLLWEGIQYARIGA